MSDHRAYWVGLAGRIARPLLNSLVAGRFREEFPVAGVPQRGRGAQAAIESLSRLLAGIGPWLESPAADPAEARLRAELLELARAALDRISRPGSPEAAQWRAGIAAVVDAGFMAHALLRAPEALWLGLDPAVRANLLDSLRATRTHKPWFNNWLLFCAILEAFLHRAGEPCDRMRIDYALRQHEQWYAGDGLYKDGPVYHADYYNSFVIHPMLVDTLRFGPREPGWEAMEERARLRLTRLAAILERHISPEGTFPPLGRSLAYRFGAFQALSQAACMDLLPPGVAPAQVRCALTAVIRRMAEAPGTFDENGFLTIGFAGHQPAIGEDYITTASVYLCTTVLLPLGLQPDHPFWAGPDATWTSARLWNGENVPPDQPLKEPFLP